MAELIYGSRTEGVTLDFRDGYDQVLPEGITLVGIEAVSAYGGSGNDRLRGGTANDFLGGGAGSDRLNGDKGADEISNHIAAWTGAGGTAQRSSEHDRLWGDEGSDFLKASFHLDDDLGSGVIVTHNTARLGRRQR